MALKHYEEALDVDPHNTKVLRKVLKLRKRARAIGEVPVARAQQTLQPAQQPSVTAHAEAAPLQLPPAQKQPVVTMVASSSSTTSRNSNSQLPIYRLAPDNSHAEVNKRPLQAQHYSESSHECCTPLAICGCSYLAGFESVASCTTDCTRIKRLVWLGCGACIVVGLAWAAS